MNASRSIRTPTISSSKVHYKPSRSERSRNKNADVKPNVNCKEFDIDEWHTRESCDHNFHARAGPVEEDSKSITNSSYLQNFCTDFNVLLQYPEFKLPQLEGLNRVEAARLLGELLELSDYETNLVSYWILEILSTTLLECQRKGMAPENQNKTLLWIIYILKTIMYYGFKRRDMFTHLEELFIKAYPYVCYRGSIPSPYLLLKNDTVLVSESTLSVKSVNPEEDWELKKDGKENHSKLQEKLVNPEAAQELKKDGKEDRSISRTGYRKSAIKSIRRRGRGLSGLSMGKKSALIEKDADFLLLIDLIYKIFGSRFKYEVIYQVFSDPVYVQTVTIAENIFKSKCSASLTHTVGRASTTLKKSVTKVKIAYDKKKPDTRKSLKDTFLQKLMKIVLEEPIEKEETKPEIIFLPYLLPLADAVEPKLFKQNQMTSPIKKSTAGRKSLDKIKNTKLRSA